VAVREKETRDAIRRERLEVRMDDVHAQPPIIECYSAVDEEHFAPLLESKAVHPNFAETAQRDEAKRMHARGGGCAGPV